MITREIFCGRSDENERMTRRMGRAGERGRRENRIRDKGESLEMTEERLPKKWEIEGEYRNNETQRKRKHEKLQRGEGHNERERSGRGGEKEVHTKMEDRKRGISDWREGREIGQDVTREEKERTRE